MKLKLDHTAKRRNLMATTVLAGVAALGAPAAIAVVTALVPTTALAQDYTSGTLVGRVSDSSGTPVAGAAVTVRSSSTGVSQNTTTNGAGEFRAPLIPTGSYSVTIRKEGFTDIAQEGLSVRIGGESNYGFTLTTPNDLSEVIVVAKRPQPQLDFSQATKGVAIDVEQLQKQVPIARNVTAVALLAPGVVTAVSGFTNTDGTLVPSIGGSSAGENAYYINGLNITNFDTYIGAAQVPFDFYKTIEVKTGGYPAEYGRATGGVINAVSKSGTNDYYFGVHGNYTPNWARETAPNTYGTNNASATSTVLQTSLEASGPIIRDHLFFYGMYQFNDNSSQSAGNLSNTGFTRHNDSPFWGYKIDAYLTARQHLEFTQFNTETTQRQRNFVYTAPATNYTSARSGTPTPLVVGGDAQGRFGQELLGTGAQSGGDNFVAKYTGTFTDWFTISAAYGQNKDQSTSIPGNAVLPYVTDARLNGTAVRFSPTVVAANATTVIDRTDREFYRVDADLYANFVGRHHIRLGYDHESTLLNHLSNAAGAGSIPDTKIGAIVNYARVRLASQIPVYGLPLDQEFVRFRFQNLGKNGAGVDGVNEAFYIQDSWDITKRLNIQLGIRNDIFKLKTLSGETSVDLDSNWGPRLALSYDPFGNSTDKISFSYGRYFIPPASNLSFRGADLYLDQYYLPSGGGKTFTDIDPKTGLPKTLGTLVTQLNNPDFAFNVGNYSPCPAGVPRTGALGCAIYGDGSQEPGKTKSAKNLNASYEDEFILSYQKKLNNLWTLSASVTYRNLGELSEDIDNLNSGIISYCKRDPSHVGCNLSAVDINNTFDARPDYKVINPGKTAIITVRSDAPKVDDDTGLIIGISPLAGQTFVLRPEDLGFPKPKREYYSLELGFDRAWDGKWSLNGSYTLSKSVGNTEGTVKSDAGNNAQTDAGSTQEFDYPGLEDGAYGLLPNHRAHQFKLYGSYQLTDALLIGANLQVTSPRAYGCIGVYPAPGSKPASGGAGGVDPIANQYGGASRYCYNSALGYSQLTPRGASFSGDWTYQMDVSARYVVPKFGLKIPGQLVARIDVFNIFNNRQVTQFDEVGEASAATPSATYRLPILYQAPRSVRFGFDLTF